MNMRRGALVLAFSLFSIRALSAAPVESAENSPRVIQLPGGEAGIGLDDLCFSPTLGELLVPAGRTGKLDLVDPSTGKVVEIAGFSSQKDFEGGHGEGITSVSEGAGLLFVTDRSSLELSIVDPVKKAVVGRTPLSASPDYVRWLESSRELWITEPDSERFELFRFEDGPPPRAVSIGRIEVAGGPESLVFDAKRGRAYTHIEGGRTLAIDLQSHDVVATWENGCSEAKGIALDTERGLLFIGCEEGGSAVLDVATGKVLGEIELGGGIDLIAYVPARQRLYVPSGETATLAILAVSPRGTLSLLGTFATAEDSHCIAAGPNDAVYVSDPTHGRLIEVVDPYPAGPH
jgi:hypothetical protein